MPQGWRLREAAGIAATAPVSYGALVRAARVERGETVLVHAAAGGLGVAAVQIARALGCNVIGTVGSAKKVAILRRLGVEHIVDYSRRDWVEEVMRITGGKGVDVTFDPVGLVEQSIRCSKFGARVLVVGFAGREGDLEKVRANRVLLRGVRLIGYVSWRFLVYMVLSLLRPTSEARRNVTKAVFWTAITVVSSSPLQSIPTEDRQRSCRPPFSNHFLSLPTSSPILLS